MVGALRRGDTAALKQHMGEMASSLGNDLSGLRAHRSWQQAPQPIPEPQPFHVRKF